MTLRTSRASIVFAFLGFASLLGGCVTYRLVDQTETQSTYALYSAGHEIPPELRQEANANCGGSSKVVHQGEVAVGEVSQTNSQASHHRGVTYGSSQTSTSQKTEWRVTFECTKGVADAAPADSAAPAPAAAQ
jgi:hypothetical protein